MVASHTSGNQSTANTKLLSSTFNYPARKRWHVTVRPERQTNCYELAEGQKRNDSNVVRCKWKPDCIEHVHRGQFCFVTTSPQHLTRATCDNVTRWLCSFPENNKNIPATKQSIRFFCHRNQSRSARNCAHKFTTMPSVQVQSFQIENFRLNFGHTPRQYLVQPSHRF